MYCRRPGELEGPSDWFLHSCGGSWTGHMSIHSFKKLFLEHLLSAKAWQQEPKEGVMVMASRIGLGFLRGCVTLPTHFLT